MGTKAGYKSILVYESVWARLMKMRVDMRYHNMSDLIADMEKVFLQQIKKGDVRGKVKCKSSSNNS